MAALLCLPDAFSSTPQWKRGCLRLQSPLILKPLSNTYKCLASSKTIFSSLYKQNLTTQAPRKFATPEGVRAWILALYKIGQEKGGPINTHPAKEELLICKETCYFLITLVISLYPEVKHRLWVHYFLITNITLDQKIINILEWEAVQWAAWGVSFVCLFNLSNWEVSGHG